MIRRISGLRLLVSVVFRRVAIPVCLMILSTAGFAQSAAGAFEASFADLNGDRSAWLTWPAEPGWGYSVESSDQVQIDPNTGEITFAPGTGVAEPMGYSYGTGSMQAFYAVPPPPPGAIGTPDPRPFRILSVIIDVDGGGATTRLRIRRHVAEGSGSQPWLVQTTESFPWVYGQAILQWADNSFRYQLSASVRRTTDTESFSSQPGADPATLTGTPAEEYQMLRAHWQEIIGKCVGASPGEPDDPVPDPDPNAPPPARRFYRVVKSAVDSNGNFIPDWWEIQNGFQPFAANPTQAGYANPAADPDHDGLTNRYEAEARTNINNWDSDGDWASDFEEYRTTHTDPNNHRSVAPAFLASGRNLYTHLTWSGSGPPTEYDIWWAYFNQNGDSITDKLLAVPGGPNYPTIHTSFPSNSFPTNPHRSVGIRYLDPASLLDWTGPNGAIDHSDENGVDYQHGTRIWYRDVAPPDAPLDRIVLITTIRTVQPTQFDLPQLDTKYQIAQFHIPPNGCLSTPVDITPAFIASGNEPYGYRESFGVSLRLLNATTIIPGDPPIVFTPLNDASGIAIPAELLNQMITTITTIPDGQPVALLPMEVNVNDTADVKDDMVRKEQKIGTTAWRQWIPCTVKIPSASSAQITSIGVTAESGTMKFSNAQAKPGDSDAGAANVSVTLDAQGQGKFWITGITQSANKGDAKLQIRKNGATGNVLATQPMTVFWYDSTVKAEASDDANDTAMALSADKKSYGVMLGNGMDITATASVVPAGLDHTVKQIADWQLGIMQNVTSTRTWRGKNTVNGVETKAKGVYQTTDRLDTLQPAPDIIMQISEIGGAQKFEATRPANSDTVDPPFMPADVQLQTHNGAWLKWYESDMQDTFTIWSGIIEVTNGNRGTVFIPIKQNDWKAHGNSSQQNQKATPSTGNGTQPTKVPSTQRPAAVDHNGDPNNTTWSVENN